MHVDDRFPTAEGSVVHMVDRGNSSVKETHPVNLKLSSEAPILYRLELLECIFAAALEKLTSDSNSSSGSNYRQLWSPRTGETKKDWHLKSITSILEETEEKGTLMERVAALEHKLSIICMDLKRILSSSPSYEPTPLSNSYSSISDSSYKTVTDLPVVEEKFEDVPVQGQETTLRQQADVSDETSGIQNSPSGLKKMKKIKKKKSKKKETRNGEADAESSQESHHNNKKSRERRRYLRHLLHKFLHPLS